MSELTDKTFEVIDSFRITETTGDSIGLEPEGEVFVLNPTYDASDHELTFYDIQKIESGERISFHAWKKNPSNSLGLYFRKGCTPNLTRKDRIRFIEKEEQTS